MENTWEVRPTSLPQGAYNLVGNTRHTDRDNQVTIQALSDNARSQYGEDCKWYLTSDYASAAGRARSSVGGRTSQRADGGEASQTSWGWNSPGTVGIWWVRGLLQEGAAVGPKGTEVRQASRVQGPGGAQ